VKPLWFAVGLAIPVAALALLLGFRGPDTRGVRVERFSFHSRLVHRDLHEVLVRPKGAGPGRPLLVLLHGRGSSPDTFLDQGLAGALRAVGTRAPDVLLPDGGESSYWHDRRDGRWGSYLLREAIPAAVARLHVDPRRVAIGGESMGGFGALNAARLHPHRFCAVGAHSAALWLTGSSTPAGAFDDAADFARHDVISSPFPFRGPVWIDVGDHDPFVASDTEFGVVHHVRVRVWPGGHGDSYWAKHMRAYVRFYAQALGSCR
jgi:S-formylglutathione hydrolase FrmB